MPFGDESVFGLRDLFGLADNLEDGDAGIA